MVFVAASARPASTGAVAGGGNVVITDAGFQPASITINQHDPVFWQNAGTRQHTVTADDGTFDSGQLAPGQAFGNVFDTAGTYRYHDLDDSTSEGVIIVKPHDQTPLPTGPTPPSGTLPPNFHTPGPVATLGIASGVPATGGPANPQANQAPVALAAGVAVLLLLAIAAVAFRSRRPPRR
jgi:plastocyanin